MSEHDFSVTVLVHVIDVARVKVDFLFLLFLLFLLFVFRVVFVFRGIGIVVDFFVVDLRVVEIFAARVILFHLAIGFYFFQFINHHFMVCPLSIFVVETFLFIRVVVHFNVPRTVHALEIVFLHVVIDFKGGSVAHHGGNFAVVVFDASDLNLTPSGVSQ